MQARLGCLGLLALWAFLGVYLRFSGRFDWEGEGGARFAMFGLVGLVVVIVGSALERLTSRERKPTGTAPGETRAAPPPPVTADDQSPVGPAEVTKGDRGSAASLLAGVGFAAVLAAFLLRLGPTGDAVAYAVTGTLYVLGIALIVLALARRGRR
jgi:hypothetical protein